MLKNKYLNLSVIYGSLLALAVIGVLLKSEIWIVAIVGLCTAALVAVYGQMNSAARPARDTKKSGEIKVILFILICSFLSSAAPFIIYGNLGFSGVMLGTAAACAHMLVCRDTW